jgi:hypothetical protein
VTRSGITIASYPSAEARARWGEVKRGKCVRFRCVLHGPLGARSEDDWQTYGPTTLEHDGLTWFSYDYQPSGLIYGPLRWIIRQSRRGAPSNGAASDATALRAWPPAFDHCEYLQSSTGERRIVSHLNTNELDPRTVAALARACDRWNLVWKQTKPSWTGRPLMIELMPAPTAPMEET